MKRAILDFAEFLSQSLESLIRLLEGNLLLPKRRRLVIDLLVTFLRYLLPNVGYHFLNLRRNSSELHALTGAAEHECQQE
jgi:hypothetical protein